MSLNSLDLSFSIATVNKTPVCIISAMATDAKDRPRFLRGEPEILEELRDMTPDQVAHLWESLERMQRQVSVILHQVVDANLNTNG